MTRPALRKAWHRALKRIGMEHCGLGPHSLRHLGGYYCASVLKLSLETTKTLLRHSSVASTEIYFHVSHGEVRAAILDAVANVHDLPLREYVVLPESPKLEVPQHWAPHLSKLNVAHTRDQRW